MKRAFPWRVALRRHRYQMFLLLKRQSDEDSRKLASTMRRLGASKAAIFHSCYWTGRPANGRWRRFKAWFVGDFTLLDCLKRNALESAQ